MLASGLYIIIKGYWLWLFLKPLGAPKSSKHVIIFSKKQSFFCGFSILRTPHIVKCA